MSWLIKNWYIAVIAVIVGLWLIINPSDTKGEVDVIQEEQAADEFITEEETIHETTAEIKVDIKGEVQKPGVYTVHSESRLLDVVTLAEGFTEEADQRSINLAERVYDEMVIYVPNQTEVEHEPTVIPATSDSIQTDQQQVRINIATAEEIQTIPGIGQVKAQAIIEYRETYGLFTTIEDLTNVSGIGDKTLDNIRNYIMVP
ncbi:helix-hairpin-helix domain-containing protein [Gracilibacillus alcaliphilus]|uniref:helix-hairpin-helix domain-containing protein n=1 Tax=Gracilibacillus alcaliphilus TaxID=1401441 RepID=UPI00195C4208|nr:helix-hairpin-helix domain-containing protein [Gracilibacillus alcaliphilus]MBM7678871.1 competence protein ComEA [Gracilibacillus alcaliphilus]